MGFCLAVHTEGQILRLPLRPGDNLAGSDPACSLRLSHPSVSRRHAMLHVRDGQVELEDLGSRNGTRIGLRRILERETVEPGTPLAFGGLQAVLEEVLDEDLEAAVWLTETAPIPLPPAPEVSPGATISASALVKFTLEQLPGLLDRLEGGAGLGELAPAVGDALFETLPCEEVTVASLDRDGGEAGLLFTAAQPGAAAEADPAVVVEPRSPAVALRVRFISAAQARFHRPVAEVALRLLRLAAERGRPAGRGAPRPEPPALPDPPTVDPAVRTIYSQAARVATGDVSVLIRGESGTGKEVLAKYLHAASRRPGAFVALNCAALPRDLLESELFGVERGVATGVDSRPGKFELADEGTLFLDEIGDMAQETQAKILRVLQERVVYRLGAREGRPARVRVLSATNRDLDEMMRRGEFRTDLYHRVADWVVELPPLRQRRGDVPNLAAYFLAREGARLGIAPRGISKAALEALVAYGWPGNIRQLEREIARAALFLEDGDLLDTTRLSPAIAGVRESAAGSLKEILERTEREEIERALAQSCGDTQAAAARLGVGRSTLYRRMKELGVG